MGERTKIRTTKKVLPKDMSAALHLTIKGVTTYDDLRETLRANIRYLADHGAIGGQAKAHVIEREDTP